MSSSGRHSASPVSVRCGARWQGAHQYRLGTDRLVVAPRVLVVGVGLVALLPPPHASSTVLFPSSIANDVPLGSAGGLVGGGADGTEPLKAGSPSGADRVGGMLGFAGPLDTAIRGSLGNQVVLRVRADRPSYWIAETFNDWSGQSWTQTVPSGTVAYHELTLRTPLLPSPSRRPECLGDSGHPDLLPRCPRP